MNAPDAPRLARRADISRVSEFLGHSLRPPCGPTQANDGESEVPGIASILLALSGELRLM
jgi:hypothetical protein